MGIKNIPKGFDSQGIWFPWDLIPKGIKNIPKGFDSHGNKNILKGFDSHGNKNILNAFDFFAIFFCLSHPPSIPSFFSPRKLGEEDLNGEEEEGRGKKKKEGKGVKKEVKNKITKIRFREDIEEEKMETHYINMKFRLEILRTG